MSESGRFVIGIDEAGYGPSMGPLVLGATGWWIPDQIALDGMWECLSPFIQPKPSIPRLRHIPIADSKALLKGKYGWANLSLGAEWMFNWLYDSPYGSPTNAYVSERRTVSQTLQKLLPIDFARLTEVDWYESLRALQVVAPGHCYDYLEDPVDCPYSHDFRQVVIAEASQSLNRHLESSGIRFLSAQARVIDEPEFNREVHSLGNKSTLLSRLSLDLAKSVLVELLNSDFAQRRSEQYHAELYFDKHGGRSKYQQILMDCFDSEWFSIQEESPGMSRYQGKWADCEISAQFMIQGDCLLPSASASVIAKWLREVSMASLNDYWQNLATVSLKPTAGYYVDAMRFSADIAKVAEKVGVSREQYWRVK